MDLNVDEPRTVSKFKVKDKTLYALITWRENDSWAFELKIFDEDAVWSGNFSKESANIEDMDETEEEFYHNVKTALTSKNTIYSYDLDKISDATAQFSWKRHHEDVVLIHGTVSLTKVHGENRDVLIQHLFEENHKLTKQVNLNRSELITVKERLESVTKELEFFVTNETKKEHDLYGKFVKLLNAKKRRIDLLEENINELAGMD